MAELISKKIIKPSSPTPLSLRSYNLSFLDQLTCDNYMPIVLYFPYKPHNQTSQLLENSLSKLLRLYYPFAGTLVDNVSINCNDGGVTFLETRIKCTMSEILREPDASVENILFPTPPWNDAEKEHLILAQLNYFDCGGKALGVCMSHKLGDGYSLMRFVSDWAIMTRQPTEEPSLQFIGESIFPGKKMSISSLYGISRDESVAKRFSFDLKTITHLKELVAAESGDQSTTRVEVVTAFLYKNALTACMVDTQSFKPSALIQHVNLRNVVEPPLPKNSIGNMWFYFCISVSDENDMKLSRLVSKLRKGKEELYKKCKQMNLNELLSFDSELMEEQMKNDSQGVELYNCTSLCGFPTNEMDFGWGAPIRLSPGAAPAKNGFTLMNGHDANGVDAVVHLDEKSMSIFESDHKEILQFS